MGRSMYPTTFVGASTGLCTRAVPRVMRRARLARVTPLGPAILSKPRRTLPRGRMPTRARLPAAQFQLERREKRLRWAIVFTTDKWAERRARVATARTLRARRKVPAWQAANGYGAMAVLRDS